MTFDRAILPKQLKTFFTQLVEQGDCNIAWPVTGSSREWAYFHWGHPEGCKDDTSRPFFFLYGLQKISTPETISGYDRIIYTASFGLQAWCDNIQGLTEKLDDLWYAAEYIFSEETGDRTQLNGTYTFTQSDGDVFEYQNARLPQLGILNPNLRAMTPLTIEGNIKRYLGLLEFSLLFSREMPKLTKVVNIRKI